MACAGLQVLGLVRIGDAAAQAQRGDALAGGRDVVVGAFHRHDRDVPDRGQVDVAAPHGEGVGRDLSVLEDALHGRKVELGGHVHDGEVFVVELVVLVVLGRLAARLGEDLVGKGAAVRLGVHGDERGQLGEAGIDHPAGAAILEADLLDHEGVEFAHRDAVAEVGHVGRGGVRVDGAADQRQRARLRGGFVPRQHGGRRQRKRRGLAHRHDVQVGAEVADEVHEVFGVVLDVEAALAHRDVAGVGPVRDPDIAIGQKRGDRGSQQRRVVARHRRDQQHPPFHRLAPGDAEADEVAEGTREFLLDIDQVVLPLAAQDRGDVPVGLDDHPVEAALGHAAPGADQPEHRVRRHREGGISAQRARRGAKPFVRVADAFHRIVGRYAAQASVDHRRSRRPCHACCGFTPRRHHVTLTHS